MKIIASIATLLILPFAATAGTCPSSQTVIIVKCQPTYVCTKVVSCRTECRWAKDHCGKRYAYEVKVITYADVYSDGSTRTYSKTVAL
jgi:hypothetical protein